MAPQDSVDYSSVVRHQGIVWKFSDRPATLKMFVSFKVSWCQGPAVLWSSLRALEWRPAGH